MRKSARSTMRWATTPTRLTPQRLKLRHAEAMAFRARGRRADPRGSRAVDAAPLILAALTSQIMRPVKASLRVRPQAQAGAASGTFFPAYSIRDNTGSRARKREPT